MDHELGHRRFGGSPGSPYLALTVWDCPFDSDIGNVSDNPDLCVHDFKQEMVGVAVGRAIGQGGKMLLLAVGPCRLDADQLRN
jgi:hypothetical protein